jgi:hypothetical protein
MTVGIVTTSPPSRWPRTRIRSSDALDDLHVIAAAAGHVVLDRADLAALIGDRVGTPPPEGVDCARRLRTGHRDDERDAALDGELAQVALLAGRGRRSRGLGGWVVIGHGRAIARRAGPSGPGPTGLAKRPTGA